MATPPRRNAVVALRWEGRGVPRVTAKGRGETAERILRVAEESGVPLREDPALVTVLSQVDLGREIPETLYRAVAEVIAFAYSLRGMNLKQRRDQAEMAARHTEKAPTRA
jgi:flagellar biosynthesis protein